MSEIQHERLKYIHSKVLNIYTLNYSKFCKRQRIRHNNQCDEIIYRDEKINSMVVRGIVMNCNTAV